MKKSKLLLPTTVIAALGAVTPMVAMTGCNKGTTKSDFVTDTWSTLIDNCASAIKFYNTYLKAEGEVDVESESDAVLKIRDAIIESAKTITDPETQTYRFERTITLKSSYGEYDAKIRLVDVGRDAASTVSKTTFTFEFVDCVADMAFDLDEDNWATYNSETSKYDISCDIRYYLKEVFPDRLPSEVSKAIKAVTKSTYVKNGTSYSKVALEDETIYLMDENDFGLRPSSLSEYKPGTNTFSFYKSFESTGGLKNKCYQKKLFGLEGYTVPCWTRIKAGSESASNQNTYIFGLDGVIHSTSRKQSYGVAPIFNI